MTEFSVGDLVEYEPAVGPVEFGRVTSMNDQFVFVRYGLGETSAATRREDLRHVGPAAGCTDEENHRVNRALAGIHSRGEQDGSSD